MINSNYHENYPLHHCAILLCSSLKSFITFFLVSLANHQPIHRLSAKFLINFLLHFGWNFLSSATDRVCFRFDAETRFCHLSIYFCFVLASPHKWGCLGRGEKQMPKKKAPLDSGRVVGSGRRCFRYSGTSEINIRVVTYDHLFVLRASLLGRTQAFFFAFGFSCCAWCGKFADRRATLSEERERKRLRLLCAAGSSCPFDERKRMKSSRRARSFDKSQQAEFPQLLIKLTWNLRQQWPTNKKPERRTKASTNDCSASKVKGGFERLPKDVDLHDL